MITIRRTSCTSAVICMDGYEMGTVNVAWPTLLDRMEDHLAGCDPELTRKLDDAVNEIEELKEDLRNALDRV